MLENMVNFYLAPNLPADRHAFFGRNGGVSEGIYASFNFNRKSRDKAENIEKNLELVGRFYGLRAAHAGWRGALAGVIENTVKVMLEKGAAVEDITAAAGPCLQKESFEVQNDMRNLFLDRDKDNERFFTPCAGERWLCDLEAFVRHRFDLIGIKNISFSGIDTYTNPELYFSYRRCRHLGQIAVKDDFPIELSTIRL